MKRWARNKQIIDRVGLMLHQIGSAFTNTPGAGMGWRVDCRSSGYYSPTGRLLPSYRLIDKDLIHPEQGVHFYLIP